MVQEALSPSHSSEARAAIGLSAETSAISKSPILAARHKSWLLGVPARCEIPYPVATSPLIIAVGGGKGGVGKSMISANLSARLARLGFRVAALDMDCGGSNLHTYFGLTGVQHCLSEHIVHGRGTLRDILTPTSLEGLTVAASQRDDSWSVADALQGHGMNRLWSGMLSLASSDAGPRYDVIVLDLGAGAARHTIDLFCCAHLGIIAALPEPTSVENSYLFLRTTLLKLIENAGQRLNLGGALDQVIEYMATDQSGGPARSYTDKLRVLYQNHPQMIASLASALSGRSIGVLINQTRSQSDADIGRAIELAAQRYFGFTASYLGYLNYDEAAWKALRNKRLLLHDFPQALVTRRLIEATSTLLKTLGISIL